jgi:hypothetical protein
LGLVALVIGVGAVSLGEGGSGDRGEFVKICVTAICGGLFCFLLFPHFVSGRRWATQLAGCGFLVVFAISIPMIAGLFFNLSGMPS